MNIDSKWLKENIRFENYVNKSIKKVFIHIGFHKTATSSIQASLYSNKDVLYKKGIYYTENRKAANAFTLFGLLTDKSDKYDYYRERKSSPAEIENFNRDNLVTLLREIQGADCKVFIFSEEHLSLLGSVGEVTELKDIINLLMPNASIKIVCSIRNPISYAQSGLQHLIINGIVALPIKDEEFRFFQKRMKMRLVYYLEVFKSENIIIYKFEEACKHEHGPVWYFLEKILQLSPEFVSSKINIVKSNEARSYKALELLSYINKQCPLHINGEFSKMRELNDYLPILKHIKGEKFKLTNFQRETIYNDTKDDMIWYKDNFHIEYEKVTNIDDVNIPIYNEEYMEQVLLAYSELSPILRTLVYNFVKEKYEQIKDVKSKNIFKKLEYELEKLEHDENFILVDCKKQLEWFNNISDSENHIGIPQLYRNIALFCERHGQVSTAHKFMEVAREYAGGEAKAPLINMKCEEYDKIKKTKKDKSIIIVNK